MARRLDASCWFSWFRVVVDCSVREFFWGSLVFIGFSRVYMGCFFGSRFAGLIGCWTEGLLRCVLFTGFRLGGQSGFTVRFNAPLTPPDKRVGQGTLPQILLHPQPRTPPPPPPHPKKTAPKMLEVGQRFWWGLFLGV